MSKKSVETCKVILEGCHHPFSKFFLSCPLEVGHLLNIRFVRGIVVKIPLIFTKITFNAILTTDLIGLSSFYG